MAERKVFHSTQNVTNNRIVFKSDQYIEDVSHISQVIPIGPSSMS